MPAPQRRGPGWLPGLTLVATAGSGLVAAAYVAAAAGSPLADVLFWVGFLVASGPILVRLAMVAPGRSERLGLVGVLAVVLYLAHVARSPVAFIGYDELLHLRSLANVLETGRLFGANPLLPVSPGFPGLEIVTAGVIQLSGADPFAAGVVVVGAMHVLLLVALFALYVEASGSARIAGLAAGIYAIGPSFTFFDAQFAYESFALPLLPLLLLLVALRARGVQPRAWLDSAVVIVAAALAISHHITTLAAVGFLGGWAVLHLFVRRTDRYRVRPIAATAIGLAVLLVAWILAIAPITLVYLAGPVQTAIGEVFRLATEGQSRALFESATGQGASLAERVTGLAGSGLLLLLIAIGVAVVVTRMRRSLPLLLAAVALGYPAALVGRLLPTASQAAGRSLAFVFIGLSFVVALAVVALLDAPVRRRSLGRLSAAAARLAQRPWFRRAVRGGLAIAGVVVILGGVVVGAAPATRLPGSHLVGADARSVDDLGTSAATWARSVLGPGRAMAADRDARVLLGSYGDEDLVFQASHGVPTWPLFLTPDVGSDEIARLQATHVGYVVIDDRLSTALPLVPYYFEEGEIFAARHTSPIAPAVLDKWNGVTSVDRLYDNGAIRVYGVAALYGARSAATPAQSASAIAPPPYLTSGHPTASVVLGGIANLLLALGGLLAVAVPAAMLIAALRRRPSRRAPVVVLIAGVTIPVVVLAGVVLDAVGVGLGRWSWLGLGALELGLAVLWAGDLRMPRPRSVGWRSALLLIGALTVGAASLGLAEAGVPAPVEPFTQLWVAPASGSQATATIGLENDEGTPSRYHVELRSRGTTLASWTVALATGERWTLPIAVSAPAGTAVQILAYRDGAGDQPYRQVELWGPLGAAPPASSGQGAGRSTGGLGVAGGGSVARSGGGSTFEGADVRSVPVE